ncbi:hypothetical protein Cgig2_005671 [Carnegiea gigantea]|uniref:DUF4283 domain-containing protein n=1 Tax=Carnegiea gigantea TaxID=171969 RepID=A0A9Q1KVH3_9CARY|nr:hypothetical protein Cgig2_005671 [Carnegiea gigantea]
MARGRRGRSRLAHPSRTPRSPAPANTAGGGAGSEGTAYGYGSVSEPVLQLAEVAQQPNGKTRRSEKQPQPPPSSPVSPTSAGQGKLTELLDNGSGIVIAGQLSEAAAPSPFSAIWPSSRSGQQQQQVTTSSPATTPTAGQRKSPELQDSEPRTETDKIAQHQTVFRTQQNQALNQDLQLLPPPGGPTTLQGLISEVGSQHSVGASTQLHLAPASSMALNPRALQATPPNQDLAMSHTNARPPPTNTQANPSSQPTAAHPSEPQVTTVPSLVQGAAPGSASSPWGNQCSFAQLVDPNEGTELKFVPSSIINGVKCTQLEKSDVEAEVQISCIMHVMKGFLKRIWANYAIDHILYVRKGVFLVRFVQLQDKISVEKRGIYFFDSKPMLVKGWNPNMDLQTETIRSLPIWIQLPALDIKYWGMESLSKIGSILAPQDRQVH